MICIGHDCSPAKQLIFLPDFWNVIGKAFFIIYMIVSRHFAANIAPKGKILSGGIQSGKLTPMFQV
jgi:hypothetical protein